MDNYFSDWLNNGLTRLSKFFKKSLDGDQVNEYLENLNSICKSKEIFYECLDNMIESEKYFPTIKQIKNAYMQSYYKAIANGKLFYERKSDCIYCNGFGVVAAISPTGSEYAVACDKCEAGAMSKSMKKPMFDKLKYEDPIKLNNKENEIYLRIVKNKGIKKELEACPF